MRDAGCVRAAGRRGVDLSVAGRTGDGRFAAVYDRFTGIGSSTLRLRQGYYTAYLDGHGSCAIRSFLFAILAGRTRHIEFVTDTALKGPGAIRILLEDRWPGGAIAGSLGGAIAASIERRSGIGGSRPAIAQGSYYYDDVPVGDQTLSYRKGGAVVTRNVRVANDALTVLDL